jgi:acyl transferase domain-containing protein
LYERFPRFPRFAAVFDEVCGLFEGRLPGDLREVFFADGPEAQRWTDQTVFAQAGLFAVEVSLWELLRSWDVQVDAVAGHSIGEVAAAYAAGVLTLPDAVTLVAARGGLMQALPAGGAMLAVAVSELQARQLLADLDLVGRQVTIAAVNGPSAVVFSGPEPAIDDLQRHCSQAGYRVRRLRVSHAFHSPLMEPMLDDFAQVVRGLSFTDPVLTSVSTVTGALLNAQWSDPEYWVEQVREPVRYHEAVHALHGLGITAFLEAGPGATLTAMTLDTLTDAGAGDAGAEAGASSSGEKPVVAVPLLRGGLDESQAFLTGLAEAFVAGVEVDWSRAFDPAAVGRVELPTYAFQRHRYWLESGPGGVGDAAGLGLVAAGHPLLGAAVGLADGRGVVLTGQVSLRSHPWLADHTVLGTVILPGTAFVELCLRAGEQAGCTHLEELTLHAPMVLAERAGLQVQVLVEGPDGEGRYQVAVYARPAAGEEGTGGESDGWTCHASGFLTTEPAGWRQDTDPGFGPVWPPAGAQAIPVEGFYSELAGAGFDYGPVFQGLRAVWRHGLDIFAEVTLPEQAAGQREEFGIHPALLDAALHPLLLAGSRPDGQGLAWTTTTGEQGLPLPFAWRGVSLHAVGASALRVRLTPLADDEFAITVADQTGALVAQAESLTSRPVSGEQLRQAAATSGDRSLFTVEWVPVAPVSATAGAVWNYGRDWPRRDAR